MVASCSSIYRRVIEVSALFQRMILIATEWDMLTLVQIQIMCLLQNINTINSHRKRFLVNMRKFDNALNQVTFMLVLV